MLDLVDTLLASSSELDPIEDRVLEDLMRTILELRKRNLSQKIEYLQFLMEDANDKGDLKSDQYIHTLMKHTKTLNSLDKAIGLYTSRSFLSMH
jgi:hypothetical protein